ncbi:hypothetical protein IWW55_001217 [Coemansia sp. RSA 2706]|nr:hypothetical protein LPJ70_001430 [Coemansia sp. RSA 2708]KAJ2306926.1 hypothetical protein IWW55_001217 [Coemansia sp. RSA 2706]KAJ2311984.1 hypothetical protein IWW54_002346 [Coemansia sp. RSA 2705]KAJ2319345.1 hypothetical protein IWW52_002026 [Coemansia sp. RSA 2704]KAJ2328608.1 hypothetical protein IWW51_001101 [Coemansia sp. RSA 2702]
MAYAATLIPGFGISEVLNALDPETRAQSLGIFYLVWVLQTFIFMLGSSRSNWGTFLTLLFLLVTNILTCAGNWAQSDRTLHASGYIGMFTAIIAWYTVAADMLTKDTFYCRLPNPAMSMRMISDGVETAVNTPFAPALCSPHITSKVDVRTPGCHINLIHPLDTHASGETKNGDRRRSRTNSSSHMFGPNNCHIRTIGHESAIDIQDAF